MFQNFSAKFLKGSKAKRSLRIFAPTGQICCNETAIRGRVHNERTSCCGLTVYNEDEEVCCSDDTVRSRGFGATVDCSAEEAHNNCVSTATGAGTVTPYNPATHLCCDGAIQELATSNSTCCGDAVYDLGTHVCCADTSVGAACCGSSAIGEDRACCGGNQVYDTTAEVCCDEFVRRKVFGDATGCCGTAVYSTVFTACCDGAVHFMANDDDFRC